jgi:hypothetical protein
MMHVIASQGASAMYPFMVGKAVVGEGTATSAAGDDAAGTAGTTAKQVATRTAAMRMTFFVMVYL